MVNTQFHKFCGRPFCKTLCVVNYQGIFDNYPPGDEVGVSPVYAYVFFLFALSSFWPVALLVEISSSVLIVLYHILLLPVTRSARGATTVHQCNSSGACRHCVLCIATS